MLPFLTRRQWDEPQPDPRVPDESRFVIDFISITTLFLYFGGIWIFTEMMPADFWPSQRTMFLSLGALAIWRYAWWATHFVRAQIFERLVYPKMRREADALWEQGWRPERVCFMMTTYKEHAFTTRRVILSIVRELRRMKVPGSIFVGTGHYSDENVITEALSHVHDVDIEVIFVRQNAPGKRIAIGLALRCMSRRGIGPDVPVVFLDGDTIIGEDCLRKAIPLFARDKKMCALTTFERAIVHGHPFMQKWFDLRFAQRHMAMQSHALSKRVLTLTGRLSILRAGAILNEKFMSLVENDHLYHWYWGDFRFLSGDDKSTWYVLLQQRIEMTYVPDAVVYTIDRIEAAWVERAQQNLLRWSGNMLRNGARALALGPRIVPPFIWWCILDQRIAMWTCLAGPVAFIAASFISSPLAILILPPWVLLTRGLQSMFLFYYHRRIDMSFPMILYWNQIVGSILKVYILFRLPMQRWANRGDQRAGGVSPWKAWGAAYLNAVWVALFIVGVLYYTGMMESSPWDFALAVLF